MRSDRIPRVREAVDPVHVALEACRVIPVATIEDPASASAVVTALQAGGVGCIEITFRHPRAADAIREAGRVGGALVGAGTLLTPAQVDEALAAGASFGVAPGLNEAVLDRARQVGLPFFPGVATPSEMERARALGLDLVKLFPAEQLGGPAFLRAVSAVYPDLGFLPTGGIGPENVAEYLAIPAVVACGGSWLVRAELIREGRFDEIEALARDLQGST